MSKVDKNVCLNILAQIFAGGLGNGFLFPLDIAFNTFLIVWLVMIAPFYTKILV